MNLPIDIPSGGPGIIVDLFAGGGGASEGVRMALGRDPKVEGIEVLKSQFGFDDEEKRDRTFGMATLERSESVVRATLRELEMNQ